MSSYELSECPMPLSYQISRRTSYKSRSSHSKTKIWRIHTMKAPSHVLQEAQLIRQLSTSTISVTTGHQLQTNQTATENADHGTSWLLADKYSYLFLTYLHGSLLIMTSRQHDLRASATDTVHIHWISNYLWPCIAKSTTLWLASCILQPNLTIIRCQVQDAVICYHTLAPLFFSGVISTVGCCLHKYTQQFSTVRSNSMINNSIMQLTPYAADHKTFNVIRYQYLSLLRRLAFVCVSIVLSVC